MSLELTGKLIAKYDTKQVNEKFRKREFVIEIAEEINGKTYRNFAGFQLTQSKCEIIDRFNVGDTIHVKFNVKGSSYTDKRTGETKYITQLEAWYIGNK